MELADKLKILADSAKYDASCASSGARRKAQPGGLGNSDGTGICHSYTPDGRCVSLLKILLTNYCVYDCLFCVNRSSSDVPRARFLPKEIVDLTLDFYRRNYIEGLFLSSGILQSPDYTMQQLIAVAKELRLEHKFGGYIHLKAIPGAAVKLIEEAGRYADRLSANIELPTQKELTAFAPEKERSVIETTMQQIRSGIEEAEESRSKLRFAPAGQSTQMVVGASDSADGEILRTAGMLYETRKLRRIYYTAFSPFPRADARLPLQPAPLVREHRLYQADWLMRFYGFAVDEIAPSEADNLDLTIDPKLGWALRNRHFFPVDVNTAPRESLLRIPGVGYRTVDRILRVRRYHRLTLADLKKLRISMNRAQNFVVTADFNPDVLLLDRVELPSRALASTQLNLFDTASTALSGEL